MKKYPIESKWKKPVKWLIVGETLMFLGALAGYYKLERDQGT